MKQQERSSINCDAISFFLSSLNRRVNGYHSNCFIHSDTVLCYEIIQFVFNSKNGNTLSAATAETTCT